MKKTRGIKEVWKELSPEQREAILKWADNTLKPLVRAMATAVKSFTEAMVEVTEYLELKT